MITEATTMAITPTPALLERLNTAFNQARARLGVSSDRKLAEYVGVSEKQVSFWRNGRWTDADGVLISILLSENSGADVDQMAS